MSNEKIRIYLFLFMACLILSACAASNKNTLSEKQLKWYSKYQKMPSAKAFAVGPSDSAGWGYGYHSIDAAENRALKECNKRNRLKNRCVLYESQERIAIKTNHSKMAKTP